MYKNITRILEYYKYNIVKRIRGDNDNESIKLP